MLFLCSPLLHLHKIQSDSCLAKMEDFNFSGQKSMTQWWYFDCFFDDGSVLVFLFVPHQWWSEEETMPSNKSLFYFSYMDASGVVKIKNKVFDAQEVYYDDNIIKCSYFQLKRSHEKNNRNYTFDFFLDEIKGSVRINSVSKAFSPFPTGAMGRFATKYILKLKGTYFRYASYVPQGEVKCNLQISDSAIDLSGKCYHEQGSFSGLPHQMGNGWNWFHFVSNKLNIFGTPEEFFCLEKDGNRLIGGLNILDKGCVLSDKVYSDDLKKILMGGKISFTSRKLSFEILPSEKSTALIRIPSIDTDQVWGTAAQPSIVAFNHKGEEIKESGWLILETCKMSKKR